MVVNVVFIYFAFQTVPFKCHKEAQKLLPKAKLLVYKDKGHDVLITRWRSVNEEIETFLISK